MINRNLMHSAIAAGIVERLWKQQLYFARQWQDHTNTDTESIHFFQYSD